MMDYIKRLRLCIKWFQELEGSYLYEREKLQNALDFAESRCAEMGMCAYVPLSFLFVYWLLMDVFFILDLIMKNKEEELNLIIVELRKSLASLQDKLSKEESEKLVRKSR